MPKAFAGKERVKQVLTEIDTSNPSLIILLGDLPVRDFLNTFHKQGSKLQDFGYTGETYGRVHRLPVEGKEHNILPLVHPRQAAGIGSHKKTLKDLHNYWVSKVAPSISREYLGRS